MQYEKKKIGDFQNKFYQYGITISNDFTKCRDLTRNILTGIQDEYVNSKYSLTDYIVLLTVEILKNMSVKTITRDIAFSTPVSVIIFFNIEQVFVAKFFRSIFERRYLQKYVVSFIWYCVLSLILQRQSTRIE